MLGLRFSAVQNKRILICALAPEAAGAKARFVFVHLQIGLKSNPPSLEAQELRSSEAARSVPRKISQYPAENFLVGLF